MLMGGDTVVDEQCVDYWAEGTSLWNASVGDELMSFSPILTDWGLPLRKSMGQSQRVGFRPRVDSL